MPRNPEEKEKCQEKLSQMQKYLPFLDFMIDKIKKKNEASLECQLNKLQVLRSMIAEKNEKYTLDLLIKVEHIIEKLISKLDYKEDVEKSKAFVEVRDIKSTKLKMSASVSRAPSAKSNDSKIQTEDAKSQNISSSNIDIIMKSIKISVGISSSQNMDKDAAQSLEEKNKRNVSGKILGTDLDKDLDGFDLTDCSSGSKANSKSLVNSKTVTPEKAPSQDLLSSSREKLLKSLQDTLFPTRMEHTSSHLLGNKTNHSFGSEASVKSSDHNSGCEIKRGSLEINERSVSSSHNTKNRSLEKANTVTFKSIKSYGSLEKQRSDADFSVVNLKQKLKEKLSTDICEVYRVPGKSIGGSLRCLKDSRDHKKSNFSEEEELFKPDVLIKVNVPSRGNPSCPQPPEAKDKCRQDSKVSTQKVEKSSDKTCQNYSGIVKNKQTHRHSNPSEFKNNKSNTSIDKKSSNKYDKKDVNKSSEKEEKTDKQWEMKKLSDEELTDFVKKNIQHLPHLARLKPAELRKTVESNLLGGSILSDTEVVSDDSLQEFDEFLSSTNKSPKELNVAALSPNSKEIKERHPLTSLKVTNNSPKSIKPGAALRTDLKISEGTGDNIRGTDTLRPAESVDEEEDYAIKLIEETTPKTVTIVKKKGLLDLPMPETSDLFDDITSIESFESSNNSNNIRDPRLKKHTAPAESEKPNKSESSSPLNQNYQLPSFEAEPQEELHSGSLAVDSSPGASQRSERRLDERPVTPSLPPENSNGCSSKFSKELKDFFSKSRTSSYFSNGPRLTAHNSSAPKSYAEYKRMKRQEQKKLSLCETAPRVIIQNFCDNNISETSHSLNDKNKVRVKCPKEVNSNSKKRWFKNHSCNRTRKQKSQRPPQTKIVKLRDNSQERNKNREDDRQKMNMERRRVVEQEELISPLEELYQTENKPKTGRGYGIQNFKIPKKVKSPVSKSSGKQVLVKKTNVVEDDSQTKISSSGNESDSSKTSSNEKTIIDLVTIEPQEENTKATIPTTELKKKANEEDEAVIKTTNKSVSSGNKEEEIIIVETSEVDQKPEAKADSQTVPDSKTDEQPQLVVPEGTKLLNIREPTETVKNEIEEPVEKVEPVLIELEPAKKCQPEIVQCDSSVENSTLNGTIPNKNNNTGGEKSTVMSKEEITQEFVEALIRKSFESGQGKLLLAQAKLFEELGRKLNSKKLKTIQKIINSESESSSSSSESSSCSVKKKKKSKKSKKNKKKGKKSRRLVISSTSSMSSSSSSSETEESDEEKNNTKRKKLDSSETQDKVKDDIPLDETETKKNDLSGKLKTKKKKKRLDYPGCFSRKRNKSKQHQNKLIEKILNEPPVNPEETPPKEQEPKVKPKPKTKTKTELDKLHEDIKNMFISSGVITVTGQRMCRMLRNAGGKMDNLDIVKESAKMVEEEKLKKVQANLRNARSRNVTLQGSRSRSQSLDKSLDRLSSSNYMENECDQDPKLKSRPYVLLQKVDLNNFGYGVKISDDCISFSRIQGRNTAIRGFKTCKSSTSEETLDSSAKNVPKGIFLARNKRKYERINGKSCKTSYVRKKLMDIVKNLPLKMIKMKHLEFSEKKSDDTRKKKMVPKKLEKKMTRLGETKEFSNDDLVNHAFQLRRTCYRCKVCSRNFRNITEHYKTVHPEHGVLISRLSQRQATLAKSEAVKNNYKEQSILQESCTGNIKARIKGPFCYQCRMCSASSTNDVNVFFSHVTTHTGEVRFQCPNEDCSIKTATGEEIKFHILTKHPKNRYELYNKIIELFPSPIEGYKLFGFLCSKCNFVQLFRKNIEAHVSKQHSSEKIKIFKINMSVDTSNRSKIKRTVMKNSIKNSEQFLRCLPNKKKNVQLAELGTIAVVNADSQIDTDVDTSQHLKSISEEDESNGEEVTSTTKNVPDKAETKVIETDKNTQVNEAEEAVPNGNTIVEEPPDVKGVPEIQKSAVEDSVGSNDKIIETLEVGPLKSLLLENSEVYYKCRVKNCGIFTKGYEKFEQHLTFNHRRKKWNGLCQICSQKVPNDLLSALQHIGFHLSRIRCSELAEELKSNTTECLPQKAVINSEEPVRLKEGVSDCQEAKTVENTGVPYPSKPLLKVRNLLGDRLSTPKEPVNKKEIITITEEEAVQASQTEKMFTIENVRSLQSELEPGVNDINQEQVCVVNDQLSGGPGKVIVVRSCPTRKIAILPENKSVSLDVGQFNLVQTPMPTHPIMLSQVPGGAPIHLISSVKPVGQTSRIALQPVIVTSSGTFMGNSNTKPVVRSASGSATVLPVSATSETSENMRKSVPNETPGGNLLLKSKHGIEITVSLPSNDPTSPTTAARAKNLSEIPSADDQEEKELSNPLKILTSIGSKIVKDGAIYKQMLTKTKLCHLFKCMALECSFTCNSESIFTRHIGLHQAQHRLKKKKDLKGAFSAVKKPFKTFQWQQCAYCCQIHSITDSALGQHIILEHGHCTYQCAYCFYRAISQNYVEIHQNLVHSQLLKTSSRVIYKCKPLSTMSFRPAILEKRGKKHSVRPFICDQCGKNFYVIQEFSNHLMTEHQAVTAYTCHICKNLCFKANRLINHYKLHSYCTYQCAHCLHGTETEVEMVFHLCNFHFSQPAIMYLRALPEGVESQGITQLESLKVVVYENDSLNEDCITEADQESEEENAYDPLKESIDFSEIVAELGINSDSQSECEVTPLLKELASLSDQNAKDVTVKALLPNAQFSSENDNINESCSMLISSGVSAAQTLNDDKEMSIPLGQLPLEALNIKHVQHSSAKNVEPPKKSPNLNKAGINLQGRETCQSSVSKDEEKASEPSHTPYVHNLPQVLLTRTLGPKNVYPSRRLTAAKKTSDDSGQIEVKVSVENPPFSYEISSSEDGHCSENKPDKVSNSRNLEFGHLNKNSSEKDSVSIENTQPLITSVVSLSKSGFDNESSESVSSVGEDNVSVSKIVINILSDDNPSTSLKPSVNSDETFPADDSSVSLDTNPELVIDETPTEKDNAEEAYPNPKSPDIVILKEGKPNKDIETVTLDSDDEKDSGSSKAEEENNAKNLKNVPDANDEIREKNETSKHEVVKKTDSLLLDESKENKSLADVTLTENQNSCQPKDILSPIEEAICSLNKKLQSETAKAQEKVPKIDGKAGENNFDDTESIKLRTRFGSRDRKRECVEEKNGEEESRKEESNKNKKVQKELVGKELYICGNEQCTFAAENNSSLKDHLYVCDFSRLSSVLMCPHCSKNFKQFGPYLDHLKYHGEKKFHCGLCSFSSAVESATVRHLKQKHKCSITKSVPKEPPKEEHIVFYPKNHKIDKIDFEEKGYSPGDENKLPLQSVYQVNVKCAKCPYFTKVRSNMVRHLKIHMKSAETEGVIVPSTAPTNPVPCLETKEKMFDKMTNLAASSQLAQAEKEKFTALPPQLESKFPQFIAEHLRFKCCVPDCNYITVGDRMLKHHIKALHNEISHYGCPHCRSTVHADIRNVHLEKVGYHLKLHDSKLYKCGHCIYIHYQKNPVQKHSFEKHPDQRCVIQTVRDLGMASEEEHSGSEGEMSVWKCARCDEFQSPSKAKLKDHLSNDHKIKSSFQCQHCSVTGNSFKMFASHFASKHPGEKVAFTPLFYEQKVPCSKLNSLPGSSSGADSSNEHFDTTPLWQRGAPRIRHIRGILIEEEEVKTKKTKRWSVEEAETTEPVAPRNRAFYCPLCSDKKKVFFTKNEDYFRTHLYQELNYQQFACILCGKMFVNKKDFDKHHARMHPDKPPEMNQTKEDGEIIFWVDKVIAKQREQMNENKRKLSDAESSEGSSPSKKKKES